MKYIKNSYIFVEYKQYLLKLFVKLQYIKKNLVENECKYILAANELYHASQILFYLSRPTVFIPSKDYGFKM